MDGPSISWSSSTSGSRSAGALRRTASALSTWRAKAMLKETTRREAGRAPLVVVGAPAGRDAA
jgi:hypothetical protein